MRGLALRPTQFALSYGIGSLIETADGPKLIGDYDTWGKVFVAGRNPTVDTFEIYDDVASLLLKGGRIFRLPTNLDLDYRDSIPIFKALIFPRWALCEQHNLLFLIGTNDSTQCSGCIQDGNAHSARRQAIRFIRACPDGHLDDIDWSGILHVNDNTCNSTAFEWNSSGSSLRNVTIHCNSCGESLKLAEIYARTNKCSGNFPESPKLKSDKCNKKAQVVLRGSSSLRIPEILTTVTIPTRSTPLHRLLSNPLIKGNILGEGEWSKEKLLKKIKYLCEVSKVIPYSDIAIVSNSEEGQILKAIEDLERRTKDQSATPEQVKLEEFHELRHAALYGYPPNPLDSNPSFQVNKHEVRNDVKFGPYDLQVAPIENLRIVMVQKGYRRLGDDPNLNKLRETFYDDGNERWYLGVEQFGEGLFIDIPNFPDHVDDSEWGKFYNAQSSIHFNPGFIWWHTLSHRIISALSLDSGYSSASIRERVYGEVDIKTGIFSGGILLYTTQPGGDGSLGGLISLVSKFERVVSSALKNLNFCSNDPLCGEQRPSATVCNGAACYACCLLSETSCEQRNMFLDRNLLRRSIL